MNKHGQTLIVFVLLLPLLLLMLAFVVDTGLILKEKTKLNSTIKTILKTTIEEKDDENYEEKIKVLFEKNKIPTLNLEIRKENNGIQIQNEYQIESIFGKIIGIKEYSVKSSFNGKIEGNTIKIEKE